MSVAYFVQGFGQEVGASHPIFERSKRMLRSLSSHMGRCHGPSSTAACDRLGLIRAPAAGERYVGING
ncbi:hypothetical protein D3C76_662760 [compost metagenome]